MKKLIKHIIFIIVLCLSAHQAQAQYEFYGQTNIRPNEVYHYEIDFQVAYDYFNFGFDPLYLDKRYEIEIFNEEYSDSENQYVKAFDVIFHDSGSESRPATYVINIGYSFPGAIDKNYVENIDISISPDGELPNHIYNLEGSRRLTIGAPSEYKLNFNVAVEYASLELVTTEGNSVSISDQVMVNNEVRGFTVNLSNTYGTGSNSKKTTDLKIKYKLAGQGLVEKTVHLPVEGFTGRPVSSTTTVANPTDTPERIFENENFLVWGYRKIKSNLDYDFYITSKKYDPELNGYMVLPENSSYNLLRTNEYITLPYRENHYLSGVGLQEKVTINFQEKYDRARNETFDWEFTYLAGMPVEYAHSTLQLEVVPIDFVDETPPDSEDPTEEEPVEEPRVVDLSSKTLYEDSHFRIEGPDMVTHLGSTSYTVHFKKEEYPPYLKEAEIVPDDDDLEISLQNSDKAVVIDNAGEAVENSIIYQSKRATFKIKDFHPGKSDLEKRHFAHFKMEYGTHEIGLDHVIIDFEIEVVYLPYRDKHRFKYNPSNLDYNLIHSTTYLEPAKDENKGYSAIQNKKYFDGLGRPIQEIALSQGGDKEDIISIVELDDYGRAAVNALPFAKKRAGAEIGRVVKNPDRELYNFYSKNSRASSGYPYSRSHYENSSLGRLKEQSSPGEAWQKYEGTDLNNTIKYENEQKSISHFFVDYVDQNLSAPRLIRNHSRPVQLRIVKDENWQPESGKNHTTEEYVDFNGKVVLKKTYNNNEAHNTYYIYDDYGNLSYVLPPKVTVASTGGISEGDLKEFCYQYIYDARNRLVRKKTPGKEWEEIVYDFADRPILTKQFLVAQKNINENLCNAWNFTKYDNLGRVYSSGLAYIKADIGREQLQNYQNEELRDDFFENPLTNIPEEEELTHNYFDNYEFDLSGGEQPSTLIFNQEITSNTTGLSTGSKIRILDTDQWITTVTYYDEKARPIYVYSNNEYLETIDILTTQYHDFTGKVLKTRSRHKKGNNPEIVTVDTFNYDHAGRLLDQKQFVGDDNLRVDNTGSLFSNTTVVKGPIPDIELVGHFWTKHVKKEGENKVIANKGIDLVSGFEFSADNPADEFITDILSEETETVLKNESGTLIVSNIYDSLGQLENKKVGNNEDNPLQTVDYKYNIRGWLTHINNPEIALDNDLFAFKINYAKPQIAGSTALYNGNISETHWKTANDNNLRNYSYNYDALNRIVGATGSSTDFNLTSVGYDKMGNITNLERRGTINQDSNNFGVMDNLEYTYIGNQLQKVTDAGNKTYGFKDGNTQGDDYGYDDNGNMISDANKGISLITYNHLNLPTQVQTDQGVINYTYDATGVKQSKRVVESLGNTATTKYAGNYVYENDKLQFFNHPEGYVEPKNIENYQEGFTYVYQYKDHLGNIRLSYADDNNDGIIQTDGANSEIREEKNYYPFGLTHKGYNNEKRGRTHKYGFIGKEEQDELSLKWLDFGWRNYDAALGRWMNIDQLAERRQELTPFNYVQNSPLVRFDPNGLTDFTLNKETGEVEQYGEDNDDKTDRIVKTYNSGKKKGQVKTYKRGKKQGQAKTAIGNVQKGILKDGQNLKTADQLIEVGGKGQPTEGGVKSFAVKLSEHLGVEIGGSTFGKEGTSHVSIGMYLGNGIKNSISKGLTTIGKSFKTVSDYKTFLSTQTELWHTHPTGGGISNSDIYSPSKLDDASKKSALKHNPSLRFLILTKSLTGKRFEENPF